MINRLVKIIVITCSSICVFFRRRFFYQAQSFACCNVALYQLDIARFYHKQGEALPPQKFGRLNFVFYMYCDWSCCPERSSWVFKISENRLVAGTPRQSPLMELTVLPRPELHPRSRRLLLASPNTFTKICLCCWNMILLVWLLLDSGILTTGERGNCSLNFRMSANF